MTNRGNDQNFNTATIFHGSLGFGHSPALNFIFVFVFISGLEVLYGVIVKWNPEKKFGFIAPDRGPDIFFHISSIGGCQPIRVELGQPVKFELVPGTEPKRPIRISKLDGPPKVPAEKPQAPQAKLVEFIDKIPGAVIENLDESVKITHHPRARQKKPNWRR